VGRYGPCLLGLARAGWGEICSTWNHEWNHVARAVVPSARVPPRARQPLGRIDCGGGHCINDGASRNRYRDRLGAQRRTLPEGAVSPRRWIADAAPMASWRAPSTTGSRRPPCSKSWGTIK
jgi:hypothetical protein